MKKKKSVIPEDAEAIDLIERVTTEDKRFYKVTRKDGTEVYYPSVSTVLHSVKVDSYFLDNWKEEQAEKLGMLGKRIQLYLDAERGTVVHNAIELWHKGEDLDWAKSKMTKDEWARVCKYMNWETERKPKFLKNEMMLWSEQYGWAGQCDGIVEIDGKRYIIDFKTGKDLYLSNKLQIAAYWSAYQEMTGEALDGCILLCLGYEKNRKGFKEMILEGEELAYYLDGFIYHKQLFDWSNRDFSPKHELLPARFSH